MAMPPPMVPAPITRDLLDRRACGVSAGTSGILAGGALGRRRRGAAPSIRASASARMKSSRSSFMPSSNFILVDRGRPHRRTSAAPGSSSPSRRPCCARTGSRRRRSGCSTLQVAHQRQRPRRRRLLARERDRAPRPASPSTILSNSFWPGSLRQQLALHRLAADDHVQRGLDAEHARQALRAAGAGHQAELHFGQRDLRARRGDAVVAAERQLQAAAHARRCGSRRRPAWCSLSSAAITRQQVGLGERLRRAELA